MHARRTLFALAATLALVSGCYAPRKYAETIPRGSLVIVSKSDDTATFIDTSSQQARFHVPTGDGPHEVAVSPSGSLAVVTNYGEREPGNTLTVIDTVAGVVARTIDLGEYQRPHGILYMDLERVLVTCEAQRALLIVHIAQGVVVRAMDTRQEGSHMVVISHGGGRAYVANLESGSVSVIDLEGGALVGIVPTGAGCEGIAISPDGSQVWTSNRDADTLSVIDTESLRVVAQIPCAGYPIRLKFTPSGQRVLVSCARSGEVAIFDVPSRSPVERIPMKLTAADGSEKHLLAGIFGDSPTPIGIQLRPDGRYAYVSNTSANVVAVIDLQHLRVTQVLKGGEQPDGLAWARESPQARGGLGGVW